MDFGAWLRDHPQWLETAYRLTQATFQAVDPLLERIGYPQVERVIRLPEEWLKGLIFDCRMCGQCVLHSTGMTCPMTCPKTLRNGPCGGVRSNGNCEVIPEMRCVWVEAYERSQKMVIYSDQISWLQPPVNRELEERSAWITTLTGEDVVLPLGWQPGSELSLISTEHD